MPPVFLDNPHPESLFFHAIAFKITPASSGQIVAPYFVLSASTSARMLGGWPDVPVGPVVPVPVVPGVVPVASVVKSL